MGLCLLSVRLSGPSTALRTFLINFVSHDDLLQVRFVISLRRSLRQFASLLRRRGDHHGLASELTRPLSVARALLLVFNEVGADVFTRGVFDGPIGSNIFRGKNLDFAIVGFACFYRAERRRHHGDRGFSRFFFDVTGSLVVAVASAGVVPVPPIRAAGVHSLAIQPAATPIAIPVVVIAGGRPYVR